MEIHLYSILIATFFNLYRQDTIQATMERPWVLPLLIIVCISAPESVICQGNDLLDVTVTVKRKWPYRHILNYDRHIGQLERAVVQWYNNGYISLYHRSYSTRGNGFESQLAHQIRSDWVKHKGELNMNIYANWHCNAVWYAIFVFFIYGRQA